MPDILKLYYYFFVNLVIGSFTVQRDYIRSEFLAPVEIGSVHPKDYQVSLGKLYVLPYRPGTTTDPKIERLFFLYPESEGNTVPQSLHLWSESYINYQSLKKEDTRWAEMDEMIDDWTRQCEEEGQAAQT